MAETNYVEPPPVYCKKAVRLFGEHRGGRTASGRICFKVRHRQLGQTL
jgi:hypothetical protein